MDSKLKNHNKKELNFPKITNTWLSEKLEQNSSYKRQTNKADMLTRLAILRITSDKSTATKFVPILNLTNDHLLIVFCNGSLLYYLKIRNLCLYNYLSRIKISITMTAEKYFSNKIFKK